jgi:hypothetical protein
VDLIDFFSIGLIFFTISICFYYFLRILKKWIVYIRRSQSLVFVVIVSAVITLVFYLLFLIRSQLNIFTFFLLAYFIYILLSELYHTQNEANKPFFQDPLVIGIIFSLIIGILVLFWPFQPYYILINNTSSNTISPNTTFPVYNYSYVDYIIDSNNTTVFYKNGEPLYWNNTSVHHYDFDTNNLSYIGSIDYENNTIMLSKLVNFSAVNATYINANLPNKNNTTLFFKNGNPPYFNLAYWNNTSVFFFELYGNDTTVFFVPFTPSSSSGGSGSSPSCVQNCPTGEISSNSPPHTEGNTYSFDNNSFFNLLFDVILLVITSIFLICLFAILLIYVEKQNTQIRIPLTLSATITSWNANIIQLIIGSLSSTIGSVVAVIILIWLNLK